MRTITYYKQSGEIEKNETLNEKTIKSCHGMKIKCILLDESEKVGFANSYYSFEKDGIVVDDDADSLEYITLETFANLDEKTHSFCSDTAHKYDVNREQVFVSSISHIDAILYSGLRWGGIPTNKFNLKTNS